jgi:hypothetical protein
MSDPGRSRPSERLLAAYVDGEVTPSEAKAVEADAAESAETQRRLAQLRRIRQGLSSSVAELESVDLVAALRRELDSAPVAERARRPWQARATLLYSLAAVAALLLLARVDLGARTARGGPQSDAEFRAKSAASNTTEAARWAGIRAHYVAPGQAPQRLIERLPPDASLLVSYTNLGARPFEFLMVFVIDARGEIGWCYPAYERAGTEPSSIRIKKGEAEMPLGDLIKLDLAHGAATLHALFSRAPLRVSEVEAWFTQARARQTPLPWPNAAHQLTEFEIAP